MNGYDKIIMEKSKKIEDPFDFWNEIIDYGAKSEPHEYWEHFKNYNLKAEIEKITSYIDSKLSAEPVPKDIKYIIFGMFLEWDENDIPRTGFYIAGSTRDEDEKGDFLCYTDWFPEWRYIKSKLLDDVMLAGCEFLDIKIEDIINEEIEEGFIEIFDYYLMLSAAISIIKGILKRIEFGRNIYVGFDEGDFFKIKGA